ncbi:MAG: HlyC/CorC family transporter [Pseudomonadales bacterium]|nr:HlyC/CorC family transporter [Pseudomonadales bacterium]
MEDPSLGALFGAVFVLVVLSAYFSGSETAMMALNRYRLKHLADGGHGGAKRASKLLERPDRLLGVILIGNNFVNFSAASITTLIAITLFGDSGVAIAPVVTTLLFLVFAEVAPKTISAAYPERVALPSSYILAILLRISYPLVWVVNGIANALLRVLGISQDDGSNMALTSAELRTVVNEGQIGDHPQHMLLSILDLERVTVNDIMVPRNEVFAIDIDDDAEEIINIIRSSQHTRLPVYKDDLENVLGMLHLRNFAKLATRGDKELNKATIMQVVEPPYFVPLNTPLQQQLVNFQQAKERVGLVVDEYGDMQGIVTLDDILEEIVGEYTTDLAATSTDIHPQEDGSYMIDGSAHIRMINRQLGWDLPVEGPKTINGLVTEELETIPEFDVCLAIGSYRIETIQIQDSLVRTVKVSKAS